MFQNANLINLLNGIPYAALLVDKGFLVRQMNHRAEALTGRGSERATGVAAENILRSNQNSFAKAFSAVITEKKIEVLEGNVLDQNRKIVPVRFTVSPVENHQNKVLGAMIVLEDITQIVESREKAGPGSYEEMVSLNPRMQDVYEHIPVFAGTDASVLIDGETGTGKGKVAEMIHNESKRSGFPFIKINCGALPPQLLESELFGHVKGAFSNADRDKPGMFRLADRGTIFFTEIGDLPLPLQAKLLTVLDDGVFIPLGSTKKVAMNVRIIAATGKDLKSMVAEGTLREDLFYRLKVLQLHLPALRERAEDIPLLIDYFVNVFSPKQTAPEIDPEAVRLLKEYSYPGNIRELRNIIEHAVTLSHGEMIGPEHLPDYLFEEQGAGMLPGWRTGYGQSAGKSITSQGSVKWNDVEKEMILEALRKSRGKRSQAAKLLGWSRSTLYRKLKNHEI